MTAQNNEENNLTQEDIVEIKKGLLERKEQIEKELADISGIDKNSPAYKIRFPDFGSKADENAQEIGEYTTNIATEKILETTLRDINAAIERMETGEYGTCKYCKQTIGKKRMQARPVASACVACKTKLQG